MWAVLLGWRIESPQAVTIQNPMSARDKLDILTVFPDPEPLWRGADELIRRALPEHTLRFCYQPENAGADIEIAEVVMSFSLQDEHVRKATKLRWIQSLGAGVDRLISLPSLKQDVILTNMRGIHGPAVSEAALAMMLALSRNLMKAVRDQDRQQWEPWDSQLLEGRCVGILGVGAIAEVLARKCKAFGMTVLGVSSTPRAVPGFDRVHVRAELPDILGTFDYLVLLAPLDQTTRNIVDDALLARMKPSAYLINVGRGGLVDHEALLRALTQKKIAGAALDAMSPEPLPPAHPLWKLRNVLITPHLAGRHDRYMEDALKIFVANVAAFARGDIHAMINRVDRRGRPLKA